MPDPIIKEKSEIHRCARDGTIEDFVKLILLVEGDSTLVDKKNNIGHTPLHNAAAGGHEAIVDYLLDQGADQTIFSTGGNTALICACENGHCQTAFVFFLDEETKRPNGEKADANHLNDSNASALHFAVKANSKKLVELLLECGAIVNVKARCWGTPLSMALERGFIEIAELLREAGAEA